MRQLATVVLATSILTNVLLLSVIWQRSVVIAVPDGDTLQLADGRRVRLRSIDAPEKDRCMASEARQLLEQTAVHRHVRLKEQMTDSYGRILAVAFIGSINLNERMAKNGLARHFNSGSNYDTLLNKASEAAKNSEIGIYSNRCRTSAPNASCTIKGNLRSGIKSYYLPSCDAYKQVIVDEAYGDQWFCSENETLMQGLSNQNGVKIVLSSKLR